MVGKTLKKLRISAGQKQQDVAAAVFVSSSAISQYENGRSQPSRSTLEALAKHFNVTTDYLLGTSTNPRLEELMNQPFCSGITFSELLDMCAKIPMGDRQGFLRIVEALADIKPGNKQV